MLENCEKLFQNAWRGFDKIRLMLVFFSLCFCGLFAVFFRVMGVQSNPWVKLSLSFLPLFITTSMLFALGIVLSNIHFSKASGKKLGLMALVRQSLKPMASIVYLTLPLFFLYVVTWLILGVFFVLKEIPAVGELLGVLLSFGPFILIFASLVLAFLNVALLFFLTPRLAKNETMGWSLVQSVLKTLKSRLLVSIVFFLVAFLPLFFALSFLLGSALLTKASYFQSSTPLYIGMQWFFLMLPFNALLTPFVLFFFNFATECYLDTHDHEVDLRLVKNA